MPPTSRKSFGTPGFDKTKIGQQRIKDRLSNHDPLRLFKELANHAQLYDTELCGVRMRREDGNIFAICSVTAEGRSARRNLRVPHKRRVPG